MITKIQEIRNIILQNEQQSIECWQTAILSLCNDIEEQLDSDKRITILMAEMMEMKSRLEFYAPIKAVKLIDPENPSLAGYADLGAIAREYLVAKFGYKE